MNEYKVILAHVAPRIPLSGVGSHMTTLMRELENHDLYGGLYLSTFARPPKPIRALFRLRSRLLGRNLEEYWQRRELVHFRRRLRLSAGNIVHCHGEPALWAVGPAARAAGSKVVCTVHGLLSLHVRENWRDNLDRQGRESFEANDRLEREAHGFADHLIAVDTNHKNLLIERGCDNARISVIYNAVDVGRIDAQRDSPTGLSLPEQYILASRRLEPKTGIDVLLKAMSLMRTRAPLVIAGYGNQETPLRNMAVRLGIQDRVIFLGRVDHDTVLRLTWRASACVVPSVPIGGTVEATSISAIEGMATGRVVVASRMGGLQELIRDGETGLLVEPGNSEQLASALELALTNDRVRASIGPLARSYVLENLNSGEWFQRHLDVYESVLGRRTRPTPILQASSAQGTA